MGIINRALDASEQHELFTFNLGAVATADVRTVFIAPYPQTLKQVRVAALGLSGAPTHKITLNRFVVGAGATAIDITAAAAVPAVGTSGLYTPSLPAAGSSLLNLLAGDYLTVTAAGANTNMLSCTYQLVMQALQDIKTWNGTSYT
jgi:hypothetical protein